MTPHPLSTPSGPWDAEITVWASGRLADQLTTSSPNRATCRRYVAAVQRLAQLTPFHKPLYKL